MFVPSSGFEARLNHPISKWVDTQSGTQVKQPNSSPDFIIKV